MGLIIAPYSFGRLELLLQRTGDIMITEEMVEEEQPIEEMAKR